MKTEDARREHRKVCESPLFVEIETTNGFLLTCEKHPLYCENIEPSAHFLMAVAHHLGIQLTVLESGKLKLHIEAEAPNEEQKHYIALIKKNKDAIIAHHNEYKKG